ncbi:unnamed protein product [Adineta steineri]|uniref:Reelin n=1 Tax=Adineta steineri TaxID=433720 RepID=A0A813P3P8_9BILA|nr:unnamed protein product [Adineta steineri]
MMLFIILFSCIIIPINTILENAFCSLSSSNELIIQNIPTIYELNVPYTVILSSNNTLSLSYITLDIDTVFNTSNDSLCISTNESTSAFIHKIEFVLKFDKNSTKTKCIQLNLHNYLTSMVIKIADLCTNNTTDKLFDNDDKYDVQSYMRTINTTELALLDNFNWLIFGPVVQQIWYTHEGMRLSRECDAAEDGRVAIFNNPRGKRRLISRPIDVTNASLLYIRLGSGTCPPPAPTDSPIQLLITTDCLNYTKWHMIYSQRILPGIEYVTVPFSLNNITNSTTICLKIEQKGEKFLGSGSWFIDDLLIIRSRLQNDYFFDTFQAMQPANWHRLAGGQLKTCDERMSMVFESNIDIRTEIGATTIDFSLSEEIKNDHDIIFQLSKNISIDWTKWKATGYLDLNQTCTDEDVITFNGENYRQICSPMIELGQIDSIRFTISTEPCMKRNKHIPTPGAVIFLSVVYNGSTIGYSRTIRRISLRDIQQTHKTFYSRLNELRHSAATFGRICLSQYHQSSGKNVDVWSVRDFIALPLLQSNITHYIQLGLNTNCHLQQQQLINGESVNIEYSVDFGKNWHLLLKPCFLDSACPHNVQHVYSSNIILPTIGWHRITLPLPMAILQQEYTRFRISTSLFSMSSYSTSNSWALDKVFIGQCFRACNGHGWCQFNSCRCDSGFSGDFCEISNEILFNHASFLIDSHINQTNVMTYQGGRFSYVCDIISQGKSLVFSKTGFRFLRISNINGSSPKLLEFTIRLGSSNVQCLGTSKTDLDHDIKSILLLSSCSNGVHWTIIDLFRISDVLAPDFGTISRILFKEKMESENCLIEWRQMIHGGDNQDVWAIDDIIIRDVISTKSIKKNAHVKTFQTKLTYIRPGYILSFRLEPINRKESNILFDFNDIRLRINSSQIDLSKNMEIFSYHSENLTLTVIIKLPRSIWFKNVLLNLTTATTKKFDLNFIHLGVQCENNCWLNGICYEGMCLHDGQILSNQSINVSFDEEDLMNLKINIVDDELLLPFFDTTDVSAIHFQTMTSKSKKNNLLFECSPNGGVKWFELGLWVEEKENAFKDHYVSLPASCQAKHTLLRWKNSSIRIINLAFVKSQIQDYLMDQFQEIDSSKWLYPIYSINSSGLYTKKIQNNLYQLISTAITLKQRDYVIMIDTDSNMNNTHLQVDYSVDNITWHELIDTRIFQRKLNRFGRQIPNELLRRSILIRLQSDHSFILKYIYMGPPCTANCYGHGQCLWKKQQAICQCDNNQTSETNCLPNHLLLSSLHETFENKINSSIWSISPDVQITHRCYNRQSKTTPYLCFVPNNHTQQSYVMVGPFKTINSTNCSNQVLFQYSYDNGIQWHTKMILDATNNIFEKFDNLTINKNIYLRWIEENDQSCLMWNLRSVSIRTIDDKNIWCENNLNIEQKNKIDYEAQTWEFPLIQSSSILQFSLQMFPIKSTNDTNWHLLLEISSDVIHGWSNWIPLIPSCNQTTIYCEDKIGSTGSLFLAHLYKKQRNITIPIPDNYVNQEVRFRWKANQSNARFIINNVYVGADCPWFCSGHGICQSNGCLCNYGYALPYCSPDPLIVIKSEILPNELNSNLSVWAETWGYEKCSSDDQRYVFSQAGTRGLISPEFSLVDVKFIRIQLDTCLNHTDIFIDPISVQISINNGILWRTLMTIIYRKELPDQPWLIELPDDNALQFHLVRIRLFQRVTTKWTSNWILKKFEIIPQKLPYQWISNQSSLINTCNYKHYIFPYEIYSTIDLQLNDTSFLTFQLGHNPCTNGSLVTLNHSQFNLELSTDYGQTWSSIDRPSTIASNTNDIIITQPLRAIKNIFYLPLHTYYPKLKFLRIRWLAPNSTVANHWQIKNVTIRSECEILCEIESCNGKCNCLNKTNCSVSSTKTTFYERFDSSISDLIILPSLNLQSTRFIEFDIHTNCKQNIPIISLEYSRNMGLSWQLFKYYILNKNQSYKFHEDFIDEMKYDYIIIRFVSSTCLKIEQIIVSGSMIRREGIYGKFNHLNNFNSNLFISFGNGIFNGTYLIFPAINNSTTNEIITDDLNIFENIFYIQLRLVPLAYNRCINIQFSFSSDYGYTWQSIDHDDVLLYDDNHLQQSKISTWKITSMMIGSNQVRFRIRFDDGLISSDDEQLLIGISELYIGSNCINACNGHGMCLNNGQCRCNANWTNNDCSRSTIHFPNELDILKHNYYTSYGSIHHIKCGRIFNNTCKREFETNYININHNHTYVHIELDDQCTSKTQSRKNGDNWIHLQYREINSHQWITLHTFKGYEFNITKLLPSIILQLRLIENFPVNDRSAWSIEQFHIFHIHTKLQWFSSTNTKWNSTFLKLINSTNTILYETKDVYFNENYILQIEFNCTNNILQYSLDLGLKWLDISNENQLQFIPIKFHSENMTFYRLTIPLNLFTNQNNSIRFRLRFSSECKDNYLQYVYIGNKCLMNCFGHARCMNGECQMNNSILPLVDFRESFDKDFNDINWLQLESYKHETNKILWTTIDRQAITRPIDLRPMRAIKWTYYFEQIPKTCQTPIYLLISTDGTLTWSILHQFDVSVKNMNTSVEIEAINTKHYIGQFRWFQPYSSKCHNMTWGLSNIISIKSINIYFLTDYFYTVSSSRSNWETINGALLAQPNSCNNNLPTFIFNESSFSVITVPILIQSYYVLVFQFNSECNRNIKILQCRNITNRIEYRTESLTKWIKLVDMSDIACRTSLINGGYFNMHTIKLPYETYSRYEILLV